MATPEVGISIVIERRSNVLFLKYMDLNRRACNCIEVLLNAFSLRSCTMVYLLLLQDYRRAAMGSADGAGPPFVVHPRITVSAAIAIIR